jgi:voltage-gated potassium channel
VNPFRRFRLPGILLGFVLVYGIVGYMVIERWSLLDAYYMTIITITTVGYGEVRPLSAAGRIFTSTLIIGGVATMLYAFGIFAELLAGGDLIQYRRRRRMERKLAALEDHFIVCGYGRIGTRIVQEFEGQKVAYVVIDNNPEAVSRLQREDRLHVDGDAASEEVLQEAGIARARCLISAVDSDERAVYVVLAARALASKLYLVARAGRPESIRRLELAGADRVVSPYRMAGHRMAELALRPAVVDVLDTLHHGDADIAVEELLVGPGSPSIGRSLAEAGLTESGAQLLALRRREGSLYVKPEPSLVLQEGDLIVALGTEKELLTTSGLLLAPAPHA